MILFERDLPDGRRVWVFRMIYNDRIAVGAPDDGGYGSAWCFPQDGSALVAAAAWDGTGDPEGWMKNLQTGEYRDPAIR